MAAIKYIVKSTVKQRLATLYLRFVNGRNTDFIVPIPTKVYPEYWSNTTETFKQRSINDKFYTEVERNNIENDLQNLKTFVSKQFNELVKNGAEPSKEWLQSVINKHYNKAKSKGPENLNQYITRFIKEIESGERLYQHNKITKRYEASTIKSFKGFQAQLNEYQAEKKVTLNFNKINMDFYDSFLQFFNKKDYSVNSIGRHIKNLKTIMRAAMDEDLHTNTEFNRKKFIVTKVEVKNIYLTQSEVDKIQSLGLSDNPTLDIARDVFLVGVYTAQRFSDYSKIGPENIRTLDNGIRVIDLIQQKTKERVFIPIKPDLERILKKYDYRIPKTWEQKVNLHIKTIGEKAGITEKVETEATKGGLTVKTWVSKNQLIKTHTARRTGCTLMYLAGIRPIDIMKISGHKTEREFLNYIKIGKQETAEKLSLHPYFTEVKLTVAK